MVKLYAKEDDKHTYKVKFRDGNERIFEAENIGKIWHFLTDNQCIDWLDEVVSITEIEF